jgi:hypothetical protein
MPAKAFHLGTYTFKGTDPLDMVSVAAGTLLGRASLPPEAKARGKGKRVAERSGEAAAAVAPLPDILPGLRDAFVYAAAAHAAAGAVAAAAAAAGAAAGSVRRSRRGGDSAGREQAAAGAAAAVAVEYGAWLSRELARRRAALGGSAPASPRAGAPSSAR